jgi:tetratricopeptide (TPR) repeat protein
VYAVIQRRLLQLSSTAQELASLAAVVGRSFTFPVLAQASDLAEDALVRGLDELWQRRIVREQGVEAYDFSHDRIRDVAYTTISLVHRRILHRRVAQALEIIHATNLDPVSGQVAVHYEQVGLLEKAIQYYQQAAEVAMRIGAYDKATAHLKRSLALLDTLPETAGHLQQAMTQLIMLASVVSATQGHAAVEVGQIYTKALELCQRVGDKVQTFAVHLGLRTFYGHRGAWTTAHRLAEENLALAQELDEPELLQYAHMGMGMVLHELGKHDLVQAHLKQVIQQSTTQPRHWDHLFVDDVLQAGLRHSALTLWLLGYPDQARLRMDQAVTLGQTEDHFIRFVMTQRFALMLYHFLGKTELVQTWTDELIALCTKYGFSHYLAAGMMHKGWLLTKQGEWTVGIALVQQNLTAQMATGRRIFITYELALLGEAYGMAGRYGEGVAALQEGLAVVEQTGECFWQAELLRLKGELLLAQGASAPEVEPCYRQAVEIARQQNAKSLELRATISLSRLLQHQGQREEARQRLAEVYDWFTEGFDTTDLQEARALLEAWS